ncbi:MAG: hypothetical protein V1850_02500 [Candidatus Bathyarchaeota archaeon]
MPLIESIIVVRKLHLFLYSLSISQYKIKVVKMKYLPIHDEEELLENLEELQTELTLCGFSMKIDYDGKADVFEVKIRTLKKNF